MTTVNAKKRVLIITNELTPYLEFTDFAHLLNELSVKTFDEGLEIRVIMPRFGTINERRHRLHEVVRLSGINVVVDKEDHPLLIKVASLPNARLQVYFMDNEDFFKRKFVFRDADEKFFPDNTERMIFFAKSALEIVKKFGWPPDVIHCHGWMTSLIPMFLKTAYKKEPVFVHSKSVYTAQQNQFEEKLSGDLVNMVLNSVPVRKEDVAPYAGGDNEALTFGASNFADMVIQGDARTSDKVLDGIKNGLVSNWVPFNPEWAEDINLLFEEYEKLTDNVNA